MLTTTENALERLVSLSDEHEELDAASVLDLWRAERMEERQRQAARISSSANDSLHYLARVEMLPVLNEEKQEVSLQPRKVERLSIRYADLSRWAGEHGVKLGDVMDVLQLRVEAIDDKHGHRWVQDHPRSMCIDKSTREAERVKEAEEDRQHAESLARRMAVREANKAVPATKEYR